MSTAPRKEVSAPDIQPLYSHLGRKKSRAEIGTWDSIWQRKCMAKFNPSSAHENGSGWIWTFAPAVREVPSLVLVLLQFLDLLAGLPGVLRRPV